MAFENLPNGTSVTLTTGDQGTVKNGRITPFGYKYDFTGKGMVTSVEIFASDISTYAGMETFVVSLAIGDYIYMWEHAALNWVRLRLTATNPEVHTFTSEDPRVSGTTVNLGIGEFNGYWLAGMLLYQRPPLPGQLPHEAVKAGQFLYIERFIDKDWPQARVLSTEPVMSLGAEGVVVDYSTSQFDSLWGEGKIDWVPHVVAPLPPPPGVVSRIIGKITDVGTGAALSGASVTWVDKTVLSNISGNYAIENPVLASGDLTASLSGYATSSQYISAPATGDITVNLFLFPTGLPPPLPPGRPWWETAGVEIANFFGNVVTTLTGAGAAVAEGVASAASGLLTGLQGFWTWMTGSVTNMFTAAILKSATPGTPEQTTDVAAGLRSLLDGESQAVVDDLMELQTTGRKLSPAEAPAFAHDLGTLSSAAIAKWGALGILSEGVTLGQVESFAGVMRDFGSIMGFNDIAGNIVKLPYDIAVVQPWKYRLQSVFTPFVPGPSDQVRFAVREAHRPELQAGTTEDFINAMGLLGFESKWAKHFWAAHWIIPTYEQAREAFWRGILTEEAFSDLRKYADLAPAYNNVWEGLQHALPGRIDTRWLYEWGLIEKDQLMELLKSAGMHPDWLDAVAEAYIKNQLRDEKGKVRTQLITMFREGFVSEASLSTELVTLGYRKEAIDYSIQEAKLRKTFDRGMDMRNALSSALTKEEITESEFEEGLKELGMADEAVAEYKELAIMKRKLPKPPKPPEVPKTAVRVYSKPSFAMIFLDGVDTGTLTTETVEVEPGDHTVLLKKDGYYDNFEDITAVEGETIEIRLELQEVPAAV